MEELPNCIGIDVGSRRIGVAVHPPGMTQALPFETVEVSKKDGEKALRRLAEICEARDVRVLVVGWPVDMDGVARRATKRVDELIEGLSALLERGGRACEVVRWDERLTTTSAEAMLIEADLSRARRKQVVDKIAAAHILDGYLSSRRPGGLG